VCFQNEDDIPFKMFFFLLRFSKAKFFSPSVHQIMGKKTGKRKKLTEHLNCAGQWLFDSGHLQAN
tara:strand:- start:50 stop:244 length:195 start_codon:yes stop_codon:yes gene_type:complete